MASIPATELAQEVLEACLKDGTWPARTLDALVTRALDETDRALAIDATRALFGIVIERFGDLFEPALCDVYARLFSYVIARALPAYNGDELLRRYRRVRLIRRFPGGEVRRVLVLSRVTLGADIAVTSVVLDGAKERFPDAEILLVGPEKNAELFAADPRIENNPITYGRSAPLRERLSAAHQLRTIADEPGAIVIDPDSRLTQLGLIPICEDSRYYFFESRAFGGELDGGLPGLMSEWLEEVFGIEDARPFVAPLPQAKIADITVSLGVGENEAKRLGDDFEFELLRNLTGYGRPVLVDRGAGGEEAERVNALAERLGSELLHLHDGSYASFASQIVQSRLYVGYDSAGQHAAAAAQIPLVTVFTGYACERMLSRWSPAGPRSHVVAVDETNRASALNRTLEAIAEAVEAE